MRLPSPSPEDTLVAFVFAAAPMQNRVFALCRLLSACLLLLLLAMPFPRAAIAQDGRAEKSTKDAARAGGGWTEFTAKQGAKVIHVANDGDDGNPGSKNRPKATIQAAYDALRDGKADSILLRRGDRWTLSKTIIWTKSGPKSGDEGWMRVGAYGDEDDPRPVLDFAGGVGMHISPGYQSDRTISNLAFTDVHFLSKERLDNPRRAASGYAVMLVAVEWRGKAGTPFRSVLFENVKIQGFGGGLGAGKDVADLRVRRSIFTDIFNPGGPGTHCTALLAEADGLLIEENVFFRIQHSDLEGVDGVSHFAHSAYIAAQARNVVCRGNFIIKATEGLMVRAGGVYERNVSAENAVACMFGQAYGVTPTADGVSVEVRENLFLDNQDGFNLGNARGGTFTQNLLLSTRRELPAQSVTLIGRNAQNGGENIGVHGVAFTENHLSGKIRFAQPERDQRHYTGLTFTRNRDDVAPLSKDVGDFLESIGLAGATMTDYGLLLVQRDRANFDSKLTTAAILDYYRKVVGLPPLK